MSDILADYDFELPKTLIAQHPPATRDGGRVLHVADERILPIKRLPDLFSADDLLVVNNTRVWPARLTGNKISGGRVEILLERFTGKSDCLAQIRAAQTLKPSTLVKVPGGSFVVLGKNGAFYRLQAVNSRHQTTAVKRLFLRNGETPLPPYIKRPARDGDKSRYQTIFARHNGSVAAPTAGLHFSDTLLQKIKQRGVQIARLTLHIGAGTFSPIRGNLNNHTMHRETYAIGPGLISRLAAAKKRGGRIVAVGTSVLRALEAAAQSGNGVIQAGTAETDLFIRPGFNFQVVNCLFTNFHLPRSSLFVLACAFGGRQCVHAAYQKAIAEKMRFYSYGDAMLLT